MRAANKMKTGSGFWFIEVRTQAQCTLAYYGLLATWPTLVILVRDSGAIREGKSSPIEKRPLSACRGMSAEHAEKTTVNILDLWRDLVNEPPKLGVCRRVPMHT